MRRTASAIAAFTVLVGLTSLSAAPASAAASITDNGNGSFTVSGVPAAGGTNGVYLCSSAVSAATCWNAGNPVGVQFWKPDPGANGTFTVGSAMATFPANVAATLTAGTYRAITNNANALDATALVTVFAGGGGSAPVATDDSPASVLQQFAKPASGTCDAAQPSGLDWSGVASGGWGVSWAEWVNDGRGGDVCTRQINYAPALSRWTLG